MYGDDEHPISFRFQRTNLGGGSHVVVQVWSGHAGNRGHCGTLTLREDDWTALAALGQLDSDDDTSILLDAVTLRERNRRISVDQLVDLVQIPVDDAVIATPLDNRNGAREIAAAAARAAVQYLIENQLVEPIHAYRLPDLLPLRVGQTVDGLREIAQRQ